MSANVTVLDYLLAGLCEAVLKDEENDGIDISAGLIGQDTSDWIRSVANGIVQNQALIAKQAEQIKILRKELELSSDRLDAIWSNLGSIGAKNQSKANKIALESTKDQL